MVTELRPVGLTGNELIARIRIEQLRAEARDERLARLARNTHAIGSRPIVRAAALPDLSPRRTVQ
jgi:hypothetical protein